MQLRVVITTLEKIQVRLDREQNCDLHGSLLLYITNLTTIRIPKGTVLPFFPKDQLYCTVQNVRRAQRVEGPRVAQRFDQKYSVDNSLKKLLVGRRKPK